MLLKKWRLELILFLFLAFNYSYFFHQLPGWNVNTRMNLIYAIVDRGKLCIDDYFNKPGYETGDVAFYKGHYYCDKAIGLSLLGVPVYFLWRLILSQLGIYISPLLARYPITVLCVSLPSALLGILFYRFCLYFSNDPMQSLWLTLGYSLGTIVYPYSTLFFSHQTSTVLIFIAFYLLFKLVHIYIQNNKFSKSIVPISGLLAGWALITEYTIGIILLGLFVYLIYWLFLNKSYYRYTNLIKFLVPIIFISFIPLLYNYICFDNFFSFAYHYEQFPEFKLGMRRGFFGITYPSFSSFLGITFHPYRGLFFLSPFLLLSPVGFYFWFKKREYRAEFWLFLYITVTFFLFNSSYFAWWGGWATGPRHIIPMLPFFTFPILFALQKKNYLKNIFLTLVIISIGIMNIFTMVDPQVPQGYFYPLWQFSFPKLIKGEIALNLGHFIFLNNFWSLLPLLFSYIFFMYALFKHARKNLFFN